MSLQPRGRAALVAAATGMLSLLLLQTPTHSLTITLTPGPILASKLSSGTPSEMAMAGAIMGKASIAASIWSTSILDPITVKFGIEYDPTLPPSVLGFFDVDGPGTTTAFSYSTVKTALISDATSTLDATAVASLQPGPYLSMITNVTSSTPSFRTQFIPGTHDLTFNSTLRLTRANQKALGLLPALDGAPGADGTIKLNASPAVLSALDLTPGPGVDPGKLDTVTIFLHEMGHGLGFIGGVDHIDFAGEEGFLRLRPPSIGYGTDLDPSDEAIFTPLDLFRYSHDSLDVLTQPTSGATLDWAFDQASPAPGEGPYFSVDAGATMLALFSTGSFNGDGYQAQHWKDSSYIFPAPPIGVMDPDLATSEVILASAFDFMAFDAIGYDFVVVPEPASLSLLGISTLFLVFRRKRPA